MKIKFNENLEFQHNAINSITKIFKGQENSHSVFSVVPVSYNQEDLISSHDSIQTGYGNKCRITKEKMGLNVKNIQLHNGLPQTKKLDKLNFTVEMETGTGKTYVYLRTIFELNKLYGFTKFIIVVPSIAIREGVKKSIEMTKEHFSNLYENVNFNSFEYNSDRLTEIRNFATSSNIEIMIINIHKFNKGKKGNVIFRHDDKLGEFTPIEYIKQTNPIVIIDEPQTVDTTDKSREALKSFNSLCTLRYSATHKDEHNMMYKLDSVDAYEQQLVKQIEVAGVEIVNQNNTAYMKLISVDNTKSPITAKIEIDKEKKDGSIKKEVVTVRKGSDLYDDNYSGGRYVYKNYIVDEINCREGGEFVSFSSQPDILLLNKDTNVFNEDAYKRIIIRKTIHEHLEKQYKLKKKNIKVLSLFFLDRVANYRSYDKDKNRVKGKYAKYFEEEYLDAIKNPKYKKLNLEQDPQKVHNGYFSIDKKKDSSGNFMLKESSKNGDTESEKSTYDLIMKNKEELLSFDSKLAFIFSHSALKEGWDNPNIFQICTLFEGGTEMKRRQQIGRGLRIAVDQDGNRQHGFDINTLTVFANESYKDFAEGLQKQIEEDQKIKFGYIKKHSFAAITISNQTGESLGAEASEELFNYLNQNEYIKKTGQITDKLRKDLKENKLEIPDKFQEQKYQILRTIKKITGSYTPKNKAERREIKLNKQVYISEDFKQLWDKIKHKSTYKVQFDNESLIAQCINIIKRDMDNLDATYKYTKTTLDINKSGVETTDEKVSHESFENKHVNIPDIITHLQNKTNLTRKSIVDILVKSDTLEQFKNDPQLYMEIVTRIINDQMKSFIIDGIKYEKKIGDDSYWCQELFEENELTGYLTNTLESKKSVYNYTIYDSEPESKFVKNFENNPEVKLYTKLPGWFKIPTPIGTYNPDWAVLYQENGKLKLYLVVETKSSINAEDRRKKENQKIKCGEKHFEAIGLEDKYFVSNSYEHFSKYIAKKKWEQ